MFKNQGFVSILSPPPVRTREQIQLVAELLLEKETINHDDLVSLIGPRPFKGHKTYLEFISANEQSKKQDAETNKEGDADADSASEGDKVEGGGGEGDEGKTPEAEAAAAAAATSAAATAATKEP